LAARTPATIHGTQGPAAGTTIGSQPELLTRPKTQTGRQVDHLPVVEKLEGFAAHLERSLNDLAVAQTELLGNGEQ
jgi:hypothetical protein